MKKCTIPLLVVLSTGLFSSGCKKQLNVFPTTSEVDGNLISDAQSAQVVLNGVYYRFTDAGSGFDGTQSTLWVDGQETCPSELTGSLIPGFGALSPSVQFAPRQHTVEYFFDYIWQYSYALINAANGFKKNIAPVTDIPSQMKKQMLAEAAFLRAFGNTQLLLYYGQYNDPSSKFGIILRDTFVTSANIRLPRSTVAAAYTSILSDLDAAITALPSLNTEIRYANAWAAKLLKARLLINRGAPGDYAQVIGLTSDIIANGPFNLEDSVKDIFLEKGFSSREVMLGILPYPNETYQYMMYQVFREYVGSDSLVALLSDDGRNRWMYKDVQTAYGSFHAVTKYYPGDPDNPAQTPLSCYGYAFRLTEAYLLRAEAIALSNGDLATAKSLLTTVMGHAGAGPAELAAVAAAATPAALQLEIVKEYLRNFAAENGVDWYALRRLPLAAIHRLNPAITDPAKLIFPIPPSELTYNPVIQNPGY